MKYRRTITILLLSFCITAAVFGQTGFNSLNSENFPPVIRNGDLSIHFLELGNKYTGDCVYINYGDIDIIIDAGSRQSSAATITSYISNFIRDNKIEYVIATHAHQDHIAGFYSTASVTGIFESYEIGEIIDFPKTDSNTTVYNNYKNARTKAEGNGAVHYTALQCYNNEDGAQRIYDLDENVKLEILYNYFYENPAGNENNYSVCLRIIQDDRQYIFTGDLESDGEDFLADFYDENFGGLGHCVLYKGGHHGSNTSASEKLMAAISPEYVCICTCAGSAEYRASAPNVFPAQGFIDRIAPYTDKVYITTYVPDYANNVVQPYNGNIIFLVSDNDIYIICSSNDIILKDTEWFIQNRQMPDAWSSGEIP
ncbi:MAG: MBL fold metallo-hydrolase [Treponema sp.]|nr:MBL fold metallo-hydrolase [Treponema sp.]